MLLILGSISSLKKLWESKENLEISTNVQLSPKLPVKNRREVVSPVETSDAVNKNEKRPWDEKPVVPNKPPVKAVKPMLTTRSTGPTIYATPITSKPPISAKPTNLDTKTPDEDIQINSDKSEKENILEILQALESTLKGIKANANVSSAVWLQLSDKIGLLHVSCMDYADNAIPAHTKFHFRELLMRLESQAHQLRSAGCRNSSENMRYISEVNNTIKDVVNAVLR